MNRNARTALLALMSLLATQTSNTQSLTGNSAKRADRPVERSKAQGWDFNLFDAEGKQRTSQEWKSARAVALLFLADECPISNRYAPEINRLVAEYASQGIAFYGVNSDPAVTASSARKHAQSYGFAFPILLDPMQKLAWRTGVELTPTAVVLSPRGELLYRGRIDNRYLDFGKYRDVGIKPDLRLAFDAAIAGKPIAEPFTKPIGCALPPLGEPSTSGRKQ